MNSFLIVFSSWILGIVVSVVVLYLFLYNGDEEQFIFSKKQLDAHDEKVVLENIAKFIEIRALVVAKRKHEITLQQRKLLANNT